MDKQIVNESKNEKKKIMKTPGKQKKYYEFKNKEKKNKKENSA